MSGGIDTGYGDHFDDADKMVGRGLGLDRKTIEWLVNKYLEKKGLRSATDDAADQPDAERSVRG